MSSKALSAKSQRNRIRQNGFVRGHDGGSNRCCDCERACGCGWWMRVSYEYDEWECYCRECAHARVSQYDDFDEEAAAAMMNSFKGEAT